MSSKNGQEGFTDRLLLFAFVLLIIVAIIALPKYLKWRENAKVPAEINTLKRLYAAEFKYRTRISLKSTFASFKQLEDTEQIPKTCADCDENVRQLDGFRLELNRNYDETKICVRVTGSRIYAMDSEGKVFESNSGQIGCSMGEVAGTNVKEVAQ